MESVPECGREISRLISLFALFKVMMIAIKTTTNSASKINNRVDKLVFITSFHRAEQLGQSIGAHF